MAEAQDGALWIGYTAPEGVSRVMLDKDRLRVEHFTTRNGLHSDGTYSLGTGADKSGSAAIREWTYSKERAGATTDGRTA